MIDAQSSDGATLSLYTLDITTSVNKGIRAGPMSGLPI